MVSELISKYIWLIQTISSTGETGISLPELALKYERRFASPYSRRSFNNHREAIESVFGITIRCNRHTNRYMINYSEDVMDEDSSVSWLINTFAVKNVLDLGKERLSGRVSVEDSPSGEKFLLPLMQAMENLNEVEMEYSKYISESSEILHVQPFAIKQDRRRWYLAGYCHERAEDKNGRKLPNSDSKAWRVYGLDRIKSLNITHERFSLPRGFDVDTCFAQSYGPYLNPEGKAVTIRFKATEREAKYIRDLPLHRSQKEETPLNAAEHIFSIRVIPDTELVMDLCKRGARIEVLEPEDLRNTITGEFKKALEIYTNNNE